MAIQQIQNLNQNPLLDSKFYANTSERKEILDFKMSLQGFDKL
ncbi:hypothetical protein [Helicobacter fennelliae]|nr:hypothetical protein [Helicobacter fennelliae]